MQEEMEPELILRMVPQVVLDPQSQLLEPLQIMPVAAAEVAGPPLQGVALVAQAAVAQAAVRAARLELQEAQTQAVVVGLVLPAVQQVVLVDLVL